MPSNKPPRWNDDGEDPNLGRIGSTGPGTYGTYGAYGDPGTTSYDPTIPNSSDNGNHGGPGPIIEPPHPPPTGPRGVDRGDGAPDPVSHAPVQAAGSIGLGSLGGFPAVSLADYYRAAQGTVIDPTHRMPGLGGQFGASNSADEMKIQNAAGKDTPLPSGSYGTGMYGVDNYLYNTGAGYAPGQAQNTTPPPAPGPIGKPPPAPGGLPTNPGAGPMGGGFQPPPGYGGQQDNSDRYSNLRNSFGS